MYRDDALAAEARVRVLRVEIACLRLRPETAESRRLRAALRRRRRQVARARRRLLAGKATVSELAAEYGVTRITLARALKRAREPK